MLTLIKPVSDDGIISVGGFSGVRAKVGVPCVKNTMPKPSANSASNSVTKGNTIATPDQAVNM